MKTTYYDNGGETFDRITVIFDDTKNGNTYDCLGCSYTGEGFFEHSTAMKGCHLGRRVQFSDLSDELQRRLTRYFNECGLLNDEQLGNINNVLTEIICRIKR